MPSQSITIPLTQGQVAIIDAEDAERVLAHKWSLARSRGVSYATCEGEQRNGKRTRIKLHNFIMEPPDGTEVDHIDGNGLNCTHENMRAASHAENAKNRSKYRCNTSGYKGVHWSQDSARWRAMIKCEGKGRHIGYFTTAEEAANAYDMKARELHGAFARLNFPPTQ